MTPWLRSSPIYTPRAADIARLKLADAILAVATESSRDPEELKNLGLGAMALQYRSDRANSCARAIMVQRVHNPHYWNNYVEETLSKADQMSDPECRRLLVGVAETYAALVRHAEPAEKRSKGGNGQNAER